MKYRPDESTLMAYLYGELETQEKEKVDSWLEDNPEAVKELENFRQLRQLMSNLADKEVIEPPIISSTSGKAWHIWEWRHFKAVTSIAASLLLLLFAAKIVGIQISTHDSSLKISFGGNTETEIYNNEQLSKTEVSDMISVSLAEYDKNLNQEWRKMQDSLDAGMNKHLQESAQQINKLLASAGQTNQDQIAAYLADLQKQNTRFMEGYVQVANADQRQHMQELLTDFALYLEDQRTNDLVYLQARLNLIEKEKEVFKMETEQLLSGIVGNPNKYIE